MNKRNLLVGLIALGFIGAISVGENAFRQNEVRDADLLINLKGDVLELSQEQIKAQQDKVIKTIAQDITTNYFVTERFSHATNTIRLSINSSHIGEISKIDNVKAVDENVTFNVAPSDSKEVIYETEQLVNQVKNARKATPTSNASAKSMNTPAESNKGAGTLVAVLDTSFYLQHEAFTALDDNVAVKYTKEQIDALQLTNARGVHEGAPTLYHNSKVPFFYDYGGDNDRDVKSPESHGQHVAGIVGGNGSYKGIAPDCQIATMKVFDDAGTGASSNDIIEALEDCVVLQPDVISMSFGSSLLEVKEPSAQAECWKTLQAMGIMCNHSAGNEGKDNLKSTAAGHYDFNGTEFGIQNYDAESPYVNSIGSVQPDQYYYETALVVGDGVVDYMDQVTNYSSSSGDVTYDQERYLTDITNGGEQTEFDFYKVPGLGYTTDFAGLDLTGMIAVINRGDITFREKIINATEVGAIAVIIIDNDENATELNFRFDLTNSTTGKLYSPPVPVVSVLYRDRFVFGDDNNQGKLTILSDVIANNPTARTMSDFSSQGYKYDLTIKPDIVAPGTNIYSSVPGYTEDDPHYHTDSYDYMSGTSMSCPNFSGACALYLGEFIGDEEALQNAKETLMRRFQSTAQIVYTDDNTPTYESPRKAGAGLADISSAISTKQYLEGLDLLGEPSGFAKVNLLGNEDVQEKGLFNFSFLAHNEDDVERTYDLELIVLRPRYAVFDNKNYADLNGKEMVTNKDDVIAELDGGMVTLAANDTTTVNVTNLQVPQNQLDLINEKFPNGTNLEGYVKLTPKEAGYEDLNIPYAGFYGDYANAEVVEPFEFEKDPDRVYLSDITNTIGTLFTNYQRPKTDYSSDMVVLNAKSASSINTGAIVSNTANIYSYGSPIGYNSYADTRAKGTPEDPFYVGNNGYANCILIQQTVYKTCEDNSITLLDESGNVVKSSYMSDTLFGGRQLQKTSFIYSEYYISNGYFATRALSAFMFNDVEDGTYRLHFHYDTLAGGSFDKEYTVVVESTVPEIESIDKVTVENESYYRIRFDGDYLMYVVVAGAKYDVFKDELGYYALVEEEAISGNKYLYKIYNLAFGVNIAITHLDDENLFAIHGDDLANTYDFTKDVNDYDDGEHHRAKEVSIHVTKKGQALEYKNFDVSFKLLDKWSLDKANLAIYDYDPSSSEWEELGASDFSVSADGLVKFNTYVGTFRIIDLTSTGEETSTEEITTSTPDTSVDPTSEDTSVIPPSGEGISTAAVAGIVVGSVGGLSIIAVVIIIILKGKK